MKGGESMNKTIKKFAVIAMASIMLAPALVFLPANAQNNDAALWGGKKEDIQQSMPAIAAAETKDPRAIIGAAINVLMGFLGIIAVLIILFGGFKWMTAQGADDKIDEAKKLLAAGIIGLIIIMSAWAIATFVMDQVMTVSGNTGN